MSTVPPERVEVPGAGVSALVRRSADPSAPALLLIHPANLQGASWQPVADRLPAHWSWAAIDLPGHGRSVRRSAYAAGDWAIACEELLAHLGWTRVHVVGASVGAAIGACLARSATVRGLVTVGGAFEPVPDEDAESFVADVAARGARRVLTELVAGEPGMTADDVSLATGHLTLTGDRNAVRIWRAAAAASGMPCAQGIRCPVRAIVGEYDEGCPVADSRAFAAATGGQCVVLPGHGHLPMYSAAPEVAALITQHVNRIEEQEGTR